MACESLPGFSKFSCEGGRKAHFTFDCPLAGETCCQNKRLVNIQHMLINVLY